MVLIIILGVVLTGLVSYVAASYGMKAQQVPANVPSSEFGNSPSLYNPFGTLPMSLAILQITLTAVIIFIAVSAFLGFQTIKDAAVKMAREAADDTARSVAEVTADTVATKKADDLLASWLAGRGGDTEPSPGATSQEVGEMPLGKPNLEPEKEDE